MIYLRKKISFMKTVSRQQMIIRLQPRIMEKVKYMAKKEKLSVNAYVEKVLDEATLAKIPKLPKDFQIDPVIASYSNVMREFTQEELDADPRLAHIMRV